MTAKGVLLFLLLLLSSGKAFSFPAESLHVTEKEFTGTGFEFEKESLDLEEGTVPFYKTIHFKSYSFTGSESFLYRSSYETRSQKDYLKLSQKIIPGLDIPAIIFPFHVFL